MGIKGYKNISEKRLSSSVNKSVKESEKNLGDARIEKINKNFDELRDRLSTQKIKEIRKDFYRIEYKKMKEIEKNLLKLEKNLSKLKKVL